MFWIFLSGEISQRQVGSTQGSVPRTGRALWSEGTSCLTRIASFLKLKSLEMLSILISTAYLSFVTCVLLASLLSHNIIIFFQRIGTFQGKKKKKEQGSAHVFFVLLICVDSISVMLLPCPDMVSCMESPQRHCKCSYSPQKQSKIKTPVFFLTSPFSVDCYHLRHHC